MSLLPEATVASSLDIAAPIDELLVLLKEFAGFRSSPQIRRKLERVFRTMPADELYKWLRHVVKDPARQELLALVEDLTNHETYFFREKVHLDVLASRILPALIQQKIAQGGMKTISIWSAACATGEEVYTLAMVALRVLLAHGAATETSPGKIELKPDWKLEVVGSDISRQALRVARDGIYTARHEGLSSFRQFQDENFCYFEPVVMPATAAPASYQTWQVRETVRKHTRFQLFNLMDAKPFHRGFDVVFCRNVLIYIDLPAQKTIQKTLSEGLRAGGFLVMSLVDSMACPEIFKEVRMERCVIYEKK